MIPQPPPPFIGDPRMLGFHPGIRDPIPGRQRAWGPSPDFHRRRPRQRPKVKKQAQKKLALIPGSAAADTVQKEDLADGGSGWCSVCQINCYNAETLKKHLAGKRHKRQMESEKEVEKVKSGGEEVTKADQEDQVMTEAENVGTVTEGFSNVETSAEKITDKGVLEAAEMTVDAGVSKVAEVIVDAGVCEAAETTVDARVSEAAEMSKAVGVSETAGMTVDAGVSERAVMTADAEVSKTTVVTVSETVVKKDEIGVSETDEMTVDAELSETAVVTVSETVVKEDDIGVGETAKIMANAIVSEAAEKTDAGATKAVETADLVARKLVEKLVQVDPTEAAEKKSEQVAAADTPLDGTPLAGKKRGAQEGGDTTTASKRLRKPASSPGAAQNTAAEGAKVRNEAFREVCELCHVTCTSKAMLENHLKTKKHAANLKKSTGSPSVRGKKDQSKGSGAGEEESIERVKEDLTEVEGGVKELSEITDFANGKAGHSAEIQ